MGFREEIVKARRKVLPYIRFSQDLNSGAWAGPSERLYASADMGTYNLPIKGQVLQFGTFSRAVANALFSLEIPGTSSTLMDPDRDWRLYVEEPFDTLLRKWIHYLLRVHDNSDGIYDATVALGQIQSISYPSARKVALTTAVASPEILGDKIPRRIVTLDDWPKAPPESIGLPVPIIYGRISNATSVVEEEEDEVEVCCPEYTPDPFTPGTDNHVNPGVRWSDSFTHGPMGSAELLTDDVEPSSPTLGEVIGSGVSGDAWLVRNYQGISFDFSGPAISIIEGAAPDGGNLLRCSDIYGEVTRGIGPQTEQLPYGVPLEITALTYDQTVAGVSYRNGDAGGQFGACGLTLKMDAAWLADGGHQPVMEVWARTTASGATGSLIALQPWDLITPDSWVDGMLYVNATVKRKNGALYEGGGFWSTIAMRNMFQSDGFHRLEIQWKVSTYIDAYGDAYETEGADTFAGGAQVAADGWVQVFIDGQEVLHLQELKFYLQTVSGLPTDADFATYWEGVAYRPAGDATCLYLSDRLICAEASTVEVEEAAPCSENVSSAFSGGAILCPLVDTVETVSLTRATGIAAAEQDNSQQVTGVIGYVGTPGNIPGGDQTFYRVTAVKDGVEYSWSELVIIDHTEPSYDRLEWDEWPGGADTYRIYQMVSLDLNLHEDMGGTLRQETYWVKQVPAIQAPGGRQDSYGPSPRWVEWGAWGEGSPQQAAALESSYESYYLVCGHTVSEILGVYAMLPGIRETLGGFNHLTGEKMPINFEETEPRMQLLPSDAYEVITVEKPSGRFTIVKVLRDMRDVNNCSFTPLTVNVAGITVDADDASSTLITDGAQIVKHFLLNWVFNHYQTGAWFQDVESAPGLIDKDSFDVASAYAANRISGGYIGAVALIEPADARQLILEAITSFNLNLFYKNAIDNNAGAWSVKMFDTRQFDPEAVSMSEFTPNDDIIADSFQTSVSLELMANVINYMAGPNIASGEAKGWVITGQLQDYDSQERSWGRIERELILPWTRDQGTAVDVAAAHLDLRNYPFTMGAFQLLGRGVLVQPADTIKVSHPDAPGSGWTERVVFVLGHDLDMDSGITTLRFMTTPSMVT